MKLQFRFKGDYAREFGKHPNGYSRKWRCFYLIDDNNNSIGQVYQEPDYNDGGIYYNTWIDGEYIGKFKTRQAIYKFIKQHNKEYLKV